MLGGPFLGSAAVEAGLVTAGQLRSARWVRVFRDVYLHRDLRLTPRRKAQAAMLIAPANAAVGGRLAACLHGVNLLRDGDPAELVVPVGTMIRQRDGLLVRQATIAPDDLVEVRGVPVLTPLRVAFDLARSEPDPAAAAVIVNALSRSRRRVNHFDPPALLSYAMRHPGARGVRHLPQVVAYSFISSP